MGDGSSNTKNTPENPALADEQLEDAAGGMTRTAQDKILSRLHKVYGGPDSLEQTSREEEG